MILEPPKTLNDFRKIRASILKLMGNPYCDKFMLDSLSKKLEKADIKIKELIMDSIKYKDILAESIYGNLNTQLDEKIIEGLKRKGFEFKNGFELAEFIKANCRCEDNVELNEKIYFVNDIPFFYWNYKMNFETPIITQNERGTMISATYGKFAFL